ncbi:MAG: hypothetical protein OHK0039_04230 [Bacteroidia bacterium]
MLMVSFCLQAVAQFPPRPEDHFWRRKVVNRIDLNEKINFPLIRQESGYYVDGQYAEKNGIIAALFNGLKAGEYTAYDPDSLKKPLTYEDVVRKMQEIEGSLEGESDFDEEYAEDTGDGGDFESFEGEDTGDDWGFEDEDFGTEDYADETTGGFDDLGGGVDVDGYRFDTAPFESVIQFVENRIFDKTRSDMVYDIEFIEIIWTDPGEALPEKRFCTFRYKDVLKTLDQTQWKNRFNDAEYKTMREIFELRLFHSYMIDVSGDLIRALPDAEDRRQKLVEFEHHLWCY